MSGDEGCLVVEIKRGKEVLRRVEFDDPRLRFCEMYNELAEGHSIAHPVSAAMETARAIRLSE